MICVGSTNRNIPNRSRGGRLLPSSVRTSVDRNLEAFLTDLRRLVETESPTVDKAACDRAGGYLAGLFAEYARAEIIRHPQPRWGDHFEARGGGGARRVLLLRPLETVWPVRAISRPPGPGGRGRVPP